MEKNITSRFEERYTELEKTICYESPSGKSSLWIVEDYVNNAIYQGFTTTIENMPKDEAKASGVEGSFWEKYPDIVKVYTMKGADGTIYSRELCGGPHVENSKNMGTFKIQKEESSSAGVRRIKGILVK